MGCAAGTDSRRDAVRHNRTGEDISSLCPPNHTPKLQARYPVALCVLCVKGSCEPRGGLLIPSDFPAMRARSRLTVTATNPATHLGPCFQARRRSCSSFKSCLDDE